LCFSWDGVLLKFKKENLRQIVHQYGSVEPALDHCNTFKSRYFGEFENKNENLSGVNQEPRLKTLVKPVETNKFRESEHLK
jgi:hypothetical protein